LVKARLQAKKMISLINGFLNISRLESGKLEIDKQFFNLTALIQEELEEIRLSATVHSFVFEPADAMPVFADREKIGSVVSNLLSNAVKYSPKGKIITVKCVVSDNEVQVQVQDEGMGISTQDLPHIFDRYYRAETVHGQHIAGFGVGLYLSAEIIQRHEGRIWAESTKGVGSVFSFTLPL
jgi:signal transduction histidine kinase